MAKEDEGAVLQDGVEPVVSICLCTRDNLPSLKGSLQRVLVAAAAAEVACEVVVVDNDSSDGTGPYLADLQGQHAALTVVLEPEPGLSNARNSALRAARGSVLLLTDDDVEVPEGWVRQLTDKIVCGAADAVAGPVRLAPELERDWMLDYHRVRLAQSVNLSMTPPMLVGANMAMRRDLAARFGWNQELGAGRLGYAEDMLLWFQLRDIGARIVAAEGPPAVHGFRPARLSRDSWLRAARDAGRSDGYLWHHWLHSTLGWPRLRALVKDIALLVHRLRSTHTDEGADPAELELIHGAALLRQLALERRHREPLYKRRSR